MKEKNWSYMAGLMDGEGSISLSRYMHSDGRERCQFQIGITNTSLPLMRWLVENFGGVYYSKGLHEKNPNWKDSYIWRPKGRRNKRELLLSTLPYLVVKKEQAKLGLRYLDLEYDDFNERREIADACTALNKRGKSVETNTLDSKELEKIESGLASDSESAPEVIQVA